MPNGLTRRTTPNGFHCITTSCYRRKPFFNIIPFRDLFLRELERVRQEYQFVIVGYVIMPEPVHLLIGEPNEGSISTVMKMLKQRGAHTALRVMRRKLGSAPPQFWQTRFYDFNIFNDKKRVEKLKYIHRNPVKRGLANTPEDWQWSSYRYYALDEVGVVAVAEPVLAKQFASHPSLRSGWGTQ